MLITGLVNAPHPSNGILRLNKDKVLNIFAREPLVELAASLRSGERDLQAYLDVLEARFDEWDGKIHAFLPEPDRFARLEREARALIEQYPDPEGRPLLFGVPVGVKDIMHVDGMLTRAGSRLPPEVLQGPEAACVTRLKRAGALVAGKTVTTEFAYFAPGPTRNPHALEHTPGGSSSGSAAAVAAGLCPLALGTQTIGSTNRPAAFCGVVGFKPSYGKIPLDGVLLFSPSMDTLGLFTVDVASAALAASMLIDDWAPASSEGLPRLGLPTGPFLERTSEEGLEHLARVTDDLIDAGFDVEPVAVMANFDEIIQNHQLLIAAEIAREHAAWFSRFEELYQPKTAEIIRKGMGVSDSQLSELREKAHARRRQLEQVMAENNIDAWLTPSARGAAPRGLESTGDPIMNLPWTHAGLPTLTLPAGVNAQGLPLGIQLVGRWGKDAALLGFGEMLERVVD